MKGITTLTTIEYTNHITVGYMTPKDALADRKLGDTAVSAGLLGRGKIMTSGTSGSSTMLIDGTTHTDCCLDLEWRLDLCCCVPRK